MDDLGQRLSEIAGQIAFDGARTWFSPPSFGLTSKQVGAQIAAALVRELAAEEKTFGVGTLQDLADRIEKGEDGAAR